MKLLVLCSLIGLALARVDYSGHKVYRAFPNLSQNDVIKTIGEQLDLDFWADYRFDGDSVDFRVSPELQPRVEVILRHNRIPYEILIEDVEFSLRAQMFPRGVKDISDPAFYTVYHTYSEIDSWITDITNAYYPLAEAVNVGTGESLEKRNIRAVKISTGSGRPAFVINCGIHAREWVTPATCMYTANRLLSTYDTDSAVAGLMNTVDFYLIPSANPDGYEYTWTDDRMWRKTRNTPGASNCMTNCYGVDPNRNFDFGWGGGGASSNCCAQDFHGPEGFSEIETQNQKQFVEDIGNVQGYIDVHAYSQMWMYPYGYTTDDSPDEVLLNQIGRESVAAIRAVHGKRYRTGSIADVIYVASGSTADYFYSVGVRCSWAAELRDTGANGFLLPAEQIIPTGEETFEGLMTIARYISTGQCA